MASSAFSRVAKQMKTETKDLSTVLLGSSYLGEGGPYDVVIQAVDTSGAEDNRLIVTYVTPDGKTYNDRCFLTSQDGSEASLDVRRLWSACIPDKDLIGKFLDMVSDDDSAFEIFTGMKLRITLRYGRGFRVEVDGNQQFAAYDINKDGSRGDKVSEDYASIKEAQEDAEAKGLKKAWLKIGKAEATAKEENAAAFNFAYDAKTKAKGAPVTQFKVGV